MKVYIWRHNRKYHSWSMINEPCVHDDLYTDAIAIVVAETEEQALAILAREGSWRIEELRRLKPQVKELDEPRLILSEVRGE